MREQIARLRRLPTLVHTAAPTVARVVEQEITAQIARGVGPDGRPWAPTQDGQQPLRNAAKALRVSSVGNAVVATLTGVEARHHLGAVRGSVKREILPTGRIPDPITRSIRTVVDAEFHKIMGDE